MRKGDRSRVVALHIKVDLGETITIWFDRTAGLVFSGEWTYLGQD